MKIKHLLLLALLFSGRASQAAFASKHDSVGAAKPVLTLTDKLKTKASEFSTVKRYIEDLRFRDQINSTSARPVYPSSSGILHNGQFDLNALNGYDQLLMLSRNMGDKKKESEALKALGDFYALKGDLDKSLLYYKEALVIKERLKNKADIAKTAYRVAAILKHKGDLPAALAFYNYTIKTASVIKHYNLLAGAYIEVGKIKTLQQKFGEAEWLFMRKALPLYTRLGNRQGRINSFENLAKLYQQQKRYSEAKWFFIQANMLGRKIKDGGAVIASLINLANVKTAIGDMELALRDFKEAETLAAVNNDMPQLIEIKSNLSDLYYKLGNSSAAQKAVDEYVVLKDNLFQTGK